MSVQGRFVDYPHTQQIDEKSMPTNARKKTTFQIVTGKSTLEKVLWGSACEKCSGAVRGKKD